MNFLFTTIFNYLKKIFNVLENILYRVCCYHSDVYKKLNDINIDELIFDYKRFSQTEFFLVHPDLYSLLNLLNIPENNFNLNTILFLKELKIQLFSQLDPTFFIVFIFLNILYIITLFYFLNRTNTNKFNRVDLSSNYRKNKTLKHDFDRSSKILIIFVFFVSFFFYIILILYQPFFVYDYLGRFYILKEYIIFIVYYLTFVNTVIFVVFFHYFRHLYRFGIGYSLYWISIMFHLILVFEHSLSLFVFLGFEIFLILLFSPRPRNRFLRKEDLSINNDTKRFNTFIDQIDIQRSTNLKQPLNDESFDNQVVVKDTFKSKARNTF